MFVTKFSELNASYMCRIKVKAKIGFMFPRDDGKETKKINSVTTQQCIMTTPRKVQNSTSNLLKLLLLVLYIITSVAQNYTADA